MTKEEKPEKILNHYRQATVQNGKRYFIHHNDRPTKSAGEGLRGNLQNQLKHHGKLHAFLRGVLKPGLVNPHSKQRGKHLLTRFDESSIILNVGSGTDIYMRR